jgi:putative transposase
MIPILRCSIAHPPQPNLIVEYASILPAFRLTAMTLLLLTARSGAEAERKIMPRKKRHFEPGLVYHVFNRRTDKQLLFPSPRAYDDFLHLVDEGRTRYNVRVCAYCLMDTHWHQSIWVREGGDATAVATGATAVAGYLRWLSASHAIRFRVASDTRGHGHVYQDRYKSLPVRTESHYLALTRYIEANAKNAGLVERAEHWPWSSLAERINGRRRIVDAGPVPLPRDWVEHVNTRTVIEDCEDVPSE